ncbi:MAG: dephospho-CoA kinase, partial [Aquificae bacterium]|nr:dephospho-CoA kinase [Aquificota bacterium]
MLKVGLTGSIATGKSTVARLLQKEGAFVISADDVVHRLLEKEEVKRRIREILGDVFKPDGSVDRKKVAEIIFSNPEKKKQLEELLHPQVQREIKNFFSRLEREKPDSIAVAEVPLMIETGSYKNYDVVVVVYAPESLQKKRLIEKGLTEEEAEKR